MQKLFDLFSILLIFTCVGLGEHWKWVLPASVAILISVWAITSLITAIAVTTGVLVITALAYSVYGYMNFWPPRRW
jgi:hypothetical protein